VREAIGHRSFLLWLISIGLGAFAALVNLPIQEHAIKRVAAPRPAV
jgi:hypothetical protein